MTTANRLMAAGVAAGAALQLAGDNLAGIVGTAGTRAAAVKLIAGCNVILTCASAGVAAFQLPTAEASPPVVVDNTNGASPALVFSQAASADTINSLTAAASFSVTNGKSAIFWPAKNTTATPPTGRWIANLSA